MMWSLSAVETPSHFASTLPSHTCHAQPVLGKKLAKPTQATAFQSGLRIAHPQKQNKLAATNRLFANLKHAQLLTRCIVNKEVIGIPNSVTRINNFGALTVNPPQFLTNHTAIRFFMGRCLLSN